MPSKRDVLSLLTRDELLAVVDRFELSPPDRRARDGLVETIAGSKKATLAEVLPKLSRNRLKELCRAVGLDDSGREKNPLVERMLNGRHEPTESRSTGASQLGLPLAEHAPASDAPNGRTESPSERGSKSERAKSLESWIWAAACSIRGAKDAPKYKDFILPLIFTKRLCDVFDDEINRIASEVGSRAKAFKLVTADKKLVRYFLPLVPKNADDPVWSVIRNLSEKTGEQLTTHLRGIGDANPLLKGIIDRVDFNATTHGQRDIDDDRLSNLIEAISAKRLGLSDVEPDIIGRSYEYLIRKFAEGSGQSAGEFFTPTEVGFVIARIMAPEPGMDIYDPCCGSAGLLIKCRLVFDETHPSTTEGDAIPLRLYGQENEPGTWAMANMNMIIHDMDGEIQIGDSFRRPKFRDGNHLKTFDLVVANPMWNQTEFKEKDYDADELGRFPKGAGYPGGKADWGWMQHIVSSLKPRGRAAVVLDTGAASRGSGGANAHKERDVRRWFVEQDLIEGVIYLPDNLFYNTPAPGVVILLNRSKPPLRRDRMLLVNASREFTKGDPKNFIPEKAVDRIADAVVGWRDIEHFSRVVSRDEVVANDYNISPSRYVHTGGAEECRPLAELVSEIRSVRAKIETTDTLLLTLVERLVGT